MGMTTVVGLGVEGGGGADDGEEGCYCGGLHDYYLMYCLHEFKFDLKFCERMDLNQAKCVMCF